MQPNSDSREHPSNCPNKKNTYWRKNRNKWRI